MDYYLEVSVDFQCFAAGEVNAKCIEGLQGTFTKIRVYMQDWASYAHLNIMLNIIAQAKKGKMTASVSLRAADED